MMQQNTKQKGLIGLAVMLVLAIAVIFGSDPLYRMLDSKNAANPTPGTSSVKLNDGKYEAQEADFDSMGYKGIVTMEVKEGAITTLAWDCIDKDGNLKSQLSMDGKYVMTEKGPTWYDQAVALAEYVISNQAVTGIVMGEDGKTDTVASVSIDVSGFVNLVTDCMNQASGIAKPAVDLKDGTYQAEEQEFDSNGYKGMVTLEVVSGYIASVNWDCKDKDGNLKSQLSMDGKYVMTESNPKWHEQAQALAEFVIANQSADGLKMGEDGKTDTIASVSIDISGFVNLVKDCLVQAGAKETETTAKAETTAQASTEAKEEKPAFVEPSALADGTYQAEETEFDGNGYRGQVSLEVKDGAIAAVNWDCVDKDGNLKSQLSMDGKYVMTESNPKWHEQAQALAEYVVANQTADSLKMGEDGKTDTIASVSIDISGFVNLVNDCLNQAK